MARDISFACPDWKEKLKAGQTPIPDLPLNADMARRSVAFFDELRLPDVSGMPKLGQVSADWVRDIVRAAFAAEHPETEETLVREVFALVPKKNAKTTYAAAIALTAMMLWDRPNMELMVLGPTQKISARCFKQARGMIKADPRLNSVFRIQDHEKKITRIKTGSTLQIKTFGMDVVTGELPALTIIDELHLLGANRNASSVIGQITGGNVGDANSLVVYITTQSVDRPAGVFKTKLDYARDVRDGKITDRVRMLPVIYEFPEEVQTDERKPFLNPESWHYVTPNLGHSVSLERLKDLYAVAKAEGGESLIKWCSQHLNIQVGMGSHNDRWSGADYWLAAARSGLTLEQIMATSEVCVVGADGGGLDDLLGLCVIGRHRETKAWQTWCRAWADEDYVTERRKKIVSQLRDFERDGDLVFVKDLQDAYDEIAAICASIKAVGLLPEKDGIGMDPEGVGSLIDAIVEHGFGIEDIRSVPQGYKLHAAIKGTPVKLKNGSMVHCGQGLMAWCVGNARTEQRGNAQLVTKAQSGSGKIDPLMATFNAVQLMSWHPVAAPNKRLDDFLANPVMVV